MLTQYIFLHLTLATFIIYLATATPIICNGTGFIFIVATGRSGSTSLLSLLNSLPGVSLSGENEGVWNLLWRTELRLRKRRHSVEKQYSVAWKHTAEIRKPLILAGYRHILMGYINPQLTWQNGSSTTATAYVGFKEIRWAWKHELADVDFLFDLFPCALGIFNYRNDTVAQQKSAFNRKHSSARFLIQNEILKRAHQRHHNRSFLFSTEQLASIADRDAVLSWLKFGTCHVDKAPHHNINGSLTGLDAVSERADVHCT